MLQSTLGLHGQWQMLATSTLLKCKVRPAKYTWCKVHIWCKGTCKLQTAVERVEVHGTHSASSTLLWLLTVQSPPCKAYGEKYILQNYKVHNTKCTALTIQCNLPGHLITKSAHYPRLSGTASYTKHTLQSTQCKPGLQQTHIAQSTHSAQFRRWESGDYDISDEWCHLVDLASMTVLWGWDMGIGIILEDQNRALSTWIHTTDQEDKFWFCDQYFQPSSKGIKMVRFTDNFNWKAQCFYFFLLIINFHVSL